MRDGRRRAQRRRSRVRRRRCRPTAPHAHGHRDGLLARRATTTGLPVGWGVAAVDPSVIPLGTHMTVPGYGEAVAADTGGAILGATIDLWFPTTAQAMPGAGAL